MPDDGVIEEDYRPYCGVCEGEHSKYDCPFRGATDEQYDPDPRVHQLGGD